jgi:hypothetical protein
MSTNKKISGDYNIETISGNVGITSDVVITGNLTVTGTSTEITSTDTAITDRVITLNDGETGAGVTGGTSGLQIDRGTETDARIVFDESDDMWKIDSGSGSLVAIATSSGGGIGITNVVEDTTPQLGGDLDVNGQSIISASNGNIVVAPNGSGELQIDGTAIRVENSSAPSAETGYNKLYAGTVSSGGSGLFFVNDDASDELVSKSKAIVYGIIF